MSDPGEAAAVFAEARRLEKGGRGEEAARAYLRAGAAEEAIRVLRAAGRLEAGARLLAEAGLFLEAARFHVAAGDRAAALDRILRVGQREPRYREAAREAVWLAAALDTLSVRFEQFMGAFIASGPETEEEQAAFYALGELYDRRRMPENAEEVFEKLAARSPGYRDVAARVGAARTAAPVLDSSTAGILSEDEEFRRIDVRRDERGRRTPAPFSTAPTAEAPTPTRRIGATPPPGSLAASPASTASTASTAFAEGTIVADRYRIEEQIGHGGMAIVYRAQDLELSEKVALKVFRPVPHDDTGIARFRQELKVSRRLNHPNIARLYDIGLHQGQRYISMELLVGDSLERIIRRPWPVDRGLDCLIQVCEGLGAAHAQGVIHRDIKPGNVFLTREGLTKIMDFGIARERAAAGVTQAGMVVGTPEYLSPEQIRGEPALETSDLYAVGIVAYEMFTGRKPFVHDELVPLLQMHLLAPPVPPRQHRPDLPAGLDDAILKLLQKNAADRFPTARAVVEALSLLRG